MPRWHSVFHNPFYLTRKRLFTAIRDNAHFLTGNILDFGCGTKPYMSLFNYNQYIGVDYETEVSARNTGLRADVFYDGKNIPFPDNHFDAAFASEVLEHVFNPDEVLQELYRVVKPGGRIMITCPFFWPEHEQPYDYARYTSFGLKHLVEKNGFSVVNYEKTGSYFECLLQGMVAYIYFLIPHRPRVLEALCFFLFISTWFIPALALNKILPKKVKRSDYYLNNLVVMEKPATPSGSRGSVA
ncbi:MAG: class I SAM-dependent methyltransferase [Flavipsychrobacter sp.]|nr:class I SAM-dependent methyltransferase [Flavipsychrobacter sp.]